MRVVPKCPDCGTNMLMRDLARIEDPWAQEATETIRKTTGQVRIFQRLCPKCHPEKVIPFANKQKI